MKWNENDGWKITVENALGTVKVLANGNEGHIYILFSADPMKENHINTLPSLTCLSYIAQIYTGYGRNVSERVANGDEEGDNFTISLKRMLLVTW